MPIIETAKWESWEKSNTDDYGKCCVDVARRVMEILDAESGDFDTHAIICRADDDIKAGGITGFMAGAVASMVSACHSRGVEFRVKWNKGYGVDEVKALGGVVNPAILTIKTKA